MLGSVRLAQHCPGKAAVPLRCHSSSSLPGTASLPSCFCSVSAVSQCRAPEAS